MTMPVIEITTRIHASAERCFDLSRSIDMHMRSTTRTGERAIGGVTAGLIGLGEEVTWSARHFGIRQELTSRITAYDRPRYFRDSMVRGAFKRFDHDHYFERDGDWTIMRDVFNFTPPLGILGGIANTLFLTRYMRRFLDERNRVIKEVAESEEWRRYVRG
jgi:ligand-binding SRPBCC domain-containing protein